MTNPKTFTEALFHLHGYVSGINDAAELHGENVTNEEIVTIQTKLEELINLYVEKCKSGDDGRTAPGAKL